MSFENTVKELKNKVQGLKELKDRPLETKTKESVLSAIRRLTEEVEKLKSQALKEFIIESQVFVAKTPQDYNENKDKLSKYGYTVKFDSLAHDVSDRLVNAVTFKNNVKDGYDMVSLISLISQEVKTLLVGVGVEGRDVPKVMNMKRHANVVTREDLTGATYSTLKNTSEIEKRDFENLSFIYATKEISNWLIEQKELTAKTKILVVLAPEVDNKLVQYLQTKTGKAVNVVNADTAQTILDTLKKSIKV